MIINGRSVVQHTDLPPLIPPFLRDLPPVVHLPPQQPLLPTKNFLLRHSHLRATGVKVHYAFLLFHHLFFSNHIKGLLDLDLFLNWSLQFLLLVDVMGQAYFGLLRAGWGRTGAVADCRERLLLYLFSWWRVSFKFLWIGTEVDNSIWSIWGFLQWKS